MEEETIGEKKMETRSSMVVKKGVSRVGYGAD
jgi:hypothetical protein